MKHAYINKSLSQKKLDLIEDANEIIEEYQTDGFDLTLRQLYYQFVARGKIENTERSYKNLGNTITDGRLCGLIDWEAIEDRTRNVRENTHWESPRQILTSAQRWFYMDRWVNQSVRVEVWIEKDALVGVVEDVCRKHDVPLFSCRGYVSASEMHKAAQRLLRNEQHGQDTIILHLGDHDPSGVDMTRDIKARLCLFECTEFCVHRIALNMDQIQELKPPPNPAKLKDTRAKRYIKEFGRKSWELDAIEPAMMQNLIETQIDLYKDDERWSEVEQREEECKEKLAKIEI